MDDNYRIRALVNVEVMIWDIKEEKLLRTIRKHNLAVMSGRNLLRDFLYGDSVFGMTHFAIGTGTVLASATDIKLGTEVFRDIFTQMVKLDGTLNIKYYLSSSTANGYTLTEAGIFGNGASGEQDSGTLYARVVHTPIVKTQSIAVTYSWDLGFMT